MTADGDHAQLADALANAGLGALAAPEYLKVARGLPRVESLELKRRAALHLLSKGHFADGYEVLDQVLGELGMKLSKTLRQALLTVFVFEDITSVDVVDDLTLTVTGISTNSHGRAINPAGLDLTAALVGLLLLALAGARKPAGEAGEWREAYERVTRT